MRSRLGWWLALRELLPLSLAGTIGGAIAGVVITQVLTPAFGFSLLAGCLKSRPPSLSPRLLLSALLLTLPGLLLAPLAELLTCRRAGLSSARRLSSPPVE